MGESQPHVNEIDDIAIELIPGDIDAVHLVLTAHGQRTLVRLTEPLIDKLVMEFDRATLGMQAETEQTIRGMSGG